jgi:hypothetical protein
MLVPSSSFNLGRQVEEIGRRPNFDPPRSAQRACGPRKLWLGLAESLSGIGYPYRVRGNDNDIDQGWNMTSGLERLRILGKISS